MAGSVSAEQGRTQGPVSVFSIALLVLMAVALVFLVVVQNVSSLSDYFGSTTLRIITDIALVVILVLFAAYMLLRSSQYRKRLEAMVNRLQRSNTLLQALNAIQSSANATLDVQRLLDVSLEAVMPLISSAGTIFIIDESAARLVPRASYGTGMPLSDVPGFAVGEGAVGGVAASGRPVVEEDGAGGVAGRSPGRVPATRLVLPIRASNKITGVLVATCGKSAYTSEEKTLLHAVAEVLGNSITNAKLYSLTRRALDATKRAQGYMESLVNEAAIGVLTVDDRGVIMIANAEAERFLGSSLRDHLGKGTSDVLGGLGESGLALARGFQGCLESRQSYQIDRPTGGDPAGATARVDIFPLFAQAGDLIGAAAIIIPP